MPKWIGDLLSKYGFTNIMGTITSILAFATYAMDKYLGCNISDLVSHPDAVISATCQLPTWFPATWVPWAAATAGAIAFISKLLRPGTFLRNLFGGTAVIVPADSPASGANTVTPAQVATEGSPPK